MVRTVTQWRHQCHFVLLEEIASQDITSRMMMLEESTAAREEELSLLLSRAYWSHAMHMIESTMRNIHLNTTRQLVRTWNSKAILSSAHLQRDAAIQKVPMLLRAAKGEMARTKTAAMVLVNSYDKSRTAALVYGFFRWQIWARDLQLEYHCQLTSADVLLHLRVAALAGLFIKRSVCEGLLQSALLKLLHNWRVGSSLTKSQKSSQVVTPRSSLCSVSLARTPESRGGEGSSSLMASRIPSSPVASSIRLQAGRLKTTRRILHILSQKDSESTVGVHVCAYVLASMQLCCKVARACSLTARLAYCSV